MKKAIYLFIFCAGTLLSANAQKLEYTGYSGGMFVHAGHIKSKEFTVTNNGVESIHKISATAYGIGGKVLIGLSNGFRVGTEGYSSKAVYDENKSTFSVMWGGFLMDYLYSERYVSYFAGAMLGAGRAENIVVTEIHGAFNQWHEALRKRYVVGILSPYCGVEVKVSEKLRISLKADYMLGLTNTYDGWGRGVRFHLGAQFRSEKNN